MAKVYNKQRMHTTSVLDIGAGRRPYFIRFELPQVPASYTALDTCGGCLGENQRNLNAWGEKFPTPQFVDFKKADARELPFADACFDTAVLSNVISAPMNKSGHADTANHLVPGLGNKDPFYIQRRQMVAEALRVVRPGGRLLIYTDLIVHGPHAYQAVLQDLRRDPGLAFATLEDEELRVDRLNLARIASGSQCQCFLNDVLPNSSIYAITKIQ